MKLGFGSFVCGSATLVVLIVVSLGLLHWLDQVLTDQLFFTDRNVNHVPPHVTLYDEVMLVLNFI